MAEGNRGGSSIPIAPLVALLLFAGGLLVQHQPLQSDRPVAEIHQATVPHYGQDVEARLWQDPLEAVQVADRAGSTASNGNERSDNAVCGQPSAECHTPTWLKKAIGEAGKGTLVLPVMIFGGPYAEDAEDRRRNRYAVLSGLIDKGYQPVYSRGIGYAKLDNPEAKAKGFPRLVPFEQWKRASGANGDDSGGAGGGAGAIGGIDKVFLLWLTEESFNPDARARLNEFFGQVLPDSGVAVKIVGPSSEETAADLWPTAAVGNASPSLCQTDNGKAAVWRGNCVEFLAPRLTDPSSRFDDVRLSPNDREIVASLSRELRNRNLNLPTPDNPRSCAGGESAFDHIAIVVEADTHYGRSLENEFRHSLQCGESRQEPANLHIFRYFRGLDGKTSPANETGSKRSGASSADAKKETTAPEERAQGQSQFDYLLRIAARVREQNDRLETKARESWIPFNMNPAGRSIRAVVVLGSDVYDKLAILHALRERLPQAIFATTDLDAGFLQNDQLRWTRNLVVASGYDLRVHRQDQAHLGNAGELQKGAPPFRDTYQTATFLATSLALTQAPRAADGNVSRISPAACPRLFEIGDGTAVPLQALPAEGAKADHCKPGIAAQDSAVGKGIRLVTGLSLALLFGLAFSWCLRKLLRTSWQVLAAATSLLGLYAYCIITVAALPGEEPLRWLAGVSIWPSEFVRVAVVILGATLLIHARTCLTEGDGRIAHEFFREELPARPIGTSPLRRWWVDLRACLGGGFDALYCRLCPTLPDDNDTAAVDVKRLWANYRQWTSPGTVTLRIAAGVALYCGFSAVLISLDPPIAPLRGSASLALDHLTSMAAVLSMLLVLIATLGRVAVSTLFLRRLFGDGAVAKPSAWGDDTLQRFCGVDCKASRTYVDLMLSARMSESVGDIVLYPFILSVLLLVARSQLFDNWVTPWGLLAVISIGLLLVIVSALALRHSAERIRRYTIEQLIKVEVRLRGGPSPEEAKFCTPEAVRLMREVATNLRTGAFAPLSEQPIVRALILPFGGAGVMSILEYLLMAKG